MQVNLVTPLTRPLTLNVNRNELHYKLLLVINFKVEIVFALLTILLLYLAICTPFVSTYVLCLLGYY